MICGQSIAEDLKPRLEMSVVVFNPLFCFVREWLQELPKMLQRLSKLEVMETEWSGRCWVAGLPATQERRDR